MEGELIITKDYRRELQGLLRRLFQFDSADLDFGIYRIMNYKRDEIEKFIEEDLIKAVDVEFEEYSGKSKNEIEKELEDIKKRIATTLGEDALLPSGDLKEIYRNSPIAKEFHKKKEEFKNSEMGDQHKAEIFSHIHQFFSRYFDDGDFISQRRYSRQNKYAIPYNGEEVLLHWANKDQYYIKTGEYFKNYSFKVGDYRVNFRLLDVETAQTNNHTVNRVFLLKDGDEQITYDGETLELTIFFEYRGLNPFEIQKYGTKDVQKVILEDIRSKLIKLIQVEGIRVALQKVEDGKPLLEKHLLRYTRRNSSDYFIHKDLRGFLSGELDFYIKNEVLMIDDLGEREADVEGYIGRIKVLKSISLKIIDFLAQVEEFQKKLWLKRKFVIGTRWCVTINTVLNIKENDVRNDLLAEIISNDSQRNEWLRLLSIDEIQPNLVSLGYSTPLKKEFLEAHPTLMVDTSHFSPNFTDKLLQAVDDIDGQTDGVLFHSENFQALSLMQEKYREQIRCITIDPPYNRLGDSFPYKDNYRHASWLTMMYDRMVHARPLMEPISAIFSNIDENERDSLVAVLDLVFGRNNRVEELIWAQNTTHSQSPLYSTNHEYVEVYARDREADESTPGMFREPKPGYSDVMALIHEINPSYPLLADVEKSIQHLYDQHITEFEQELEDIDLAYDEETKKLDPWRGIYNYKYAEYRSPSGELVSEQEARACNALLRVWRESDPSAPAQKQAVSTQDENDLNYRFYRPIHPRTGKPCPYPKRGWAWPFSWPGNNRESFESLDRAGRIAWGDDENKIPQYKRFLDQVETNVAKSFFHDYTDGEKQISALFGQTGLFPTPKPTTLPERFIMQVAGKMDTVLDHFAGSGTTGNAVINLNRFDGGQRKFILVEMGDYFDTVLLERLKKVTFTPEWVGGKPKRLSTAEEIDRSPRMFKILRLESYEDSLNNIDFFSSGTTQRTLRELNGYFIRYMLDFETRDSPCRLNIDKLKQPFNYTLNIINCNESMKEKVNLVETFNYLLGLHVKRIKAFNNNGNYYKIVHGVKGQIIITVIWRSTSELDLESDKKFIEDHILEEFKADKVYINSDFFVEGAIPIEPEFKRLMGA